MRWPHLEVSKFFPLLFFCVCFIFSSHDFKTTSDSIGYCAAAKVLVSTSTFSCFQWMPPSPYALTHLRFKDALLSSHQNCSVSSARTRIFASRFDPVPLNSLKQKSPSCFQW